jgi:hypothetical protein
MVAQRTDAQGNPVKGPDGNPIMDPVPPPISGTLQQTITKMVNLVRGDRDPEGAAAYYAAHLDNSPGGLAGQEILQQAGAAGALRLMAGGRLPQEHAFPKIPEAPTTPVKHAPPTAAPPVSPAAQPSSALAIPPPRPAAAAHPPSGPSPRFPNPPGLPAGATYVGPGPTGGDEYQFPDGSHQEYTGP